MEIPFKYPPKEIPQGTYFVIRTMKPDISDPKPTLEKASTVTQCPTCSKSFGIFNSKYHCNACGKIYCKTHCNDFLALPLSFGYQDEVVRVCSSCYVKYNSLDWDKKFDEVGPQDVSNMIQFTIKFFQRLQQLFMSLELWHLGCFLNRLFVLGEQTTTFFYLIYQVRQFNHSNPSSIRSRSTKKRNFDRRNCHWSNSRYYCQSYQTKKSAHLWLFDGRSLNHEICRQVPRIVYWFNLRRVLQWICRNESKIIFRGKISFTFTYSQFTFNSSLLLLFMTVFLPKQWRKW
jgi:hypothetical protein